MLFNEAADAFDATIQMLAAESAELIDPYTNYSQPFTGRLSLAGHAISVLAVQRN